MAQTEFYPVERGDNPSNELEVHLGKRTQMYILYIYCIINNNNNNKIVTIGGARTRTCHYLWIALNPIFVGLIFFFACFRLLHKPQLICQRLWDRNNGRPSNSFSSLVSPFSAPHSTTLLLVFDGMLSHFLVFFFWLLSLVANWLSSTIGRGGGGMGGWSGLFCLRFFWTFLLCW